jgi:hypothetical protein
MTIRQDDRTKEQKKTHRWLVTATDKFMSGWGPCRNGVSKCAWACETRTDALKVYIWVKSRKEMKYVNITGKEWRPRAAHVHIYVAGPKHPAFR